VDGALDPSRITDKLEDILLERVGQQGRNYLLRVRCFTYSPSLVPSIKDKYRSSTPLGLAPEGRSGVQYALKAT
jgi:hypothetical protein